MIVLAFAFSDGSESLSVLVPGYLKGGETLRLLHSHSDACLTVPYTEQGEELQRFVERTAFLFCPPEKLLQTHLSFFSFFLQDNSI